MHEQNGWDVQPGQERPEASDILTGLHVSWRI